MPRWTNVSSLASSIVSITAPAGIVASLTSRIASCLSLLRVHSATIASTSSRRFVLVALSRQLYDDGSNFYSHLRALIRRIVTRIADQFLASHHPQQPVPVLRIGAAAIDVDEVFRATALARVDPDRQIASPDRF